MTTSIATEQARLVGSLQYLVITGDSKTAAASLRRLAPTYGRLADVLGRDSRGRAPALLARWRARLDRGADAVAVALFTRGRR